MRPTQSEKPGFVRAWRTARVCPSMFCTRSSAAVLEIGEEKSERLPHGAPAKRDENGNMISIEKN